MWYNSDYPETTTIHFSSNILLINDMYLQLLIKLL